MSKSKINWAELAGGTAINSPDTAAARTDMIKTESAAGSLARYEELLLRRDSLRKKAEQYQISYFKVFGDLLVESFTVRVECIKKKKIIAYCQAQVNRGKPINGAQLDHFIEREMTEYKEELDTLIKHNKAVKESGTVSDFDMYKIKKFYHGLAKLIHPDLHPDLEKDPKIMEFWQRIVLAYEHNCLKDMEELDFQVRKYLEDRGVQGAEITVPDIGKKIRQVEEEIERITGTDPYLYRLLLEDEEAVELRKEELKSEIESFAAYSRQLDEVIEQFRIERNYS